MQQSVDLAFTQWISGTHFIPTKPEKPILNLLAEIICKRYEQNILTDVNTFLIRL